MLKIGDFVKVYQKPFTSEEFEGIAKISKVLSEDKECPRYMVNFLEEKGFETSTYPRIVFDGQKYDPKM